MPNILDVFNGDAFSCVAMTESINKLPYKPGRLESLFTFKGIETTSVAIEEQAGKLSLIPAKKRNSGETTKQPGIRRKERILGCVHLPLNDEVWADDVQNIRAFGSADKLETIADKVNGKMENARQNHEVTHEYHRIGAIGGRVLDADGSTELYDLFEVFGLTKKVIDFELEDPLTKVKAKCEAVTAYIEQRLGAATSTGITAQCSQGFWSMLVSHPEVVKAYEKAQDGKFLRESQRSTGFEFCGIFFEAYRGEIGSIPFIPAGKARFYPEGVSNLFMHWGAPANWLETVNTTGLKTYAKQVPMRGELGTDIWTQSNPLIVCTQPEVLVEGSTAVLSLGSGVVNE